MPIDLAYSPLALFSRAHCGAICAFLVPVNLGLVLAALGKTAMDRCPRQEIGKIIGCSLLGATILALHVGTWLVIGVIHPFTFILLGLATICFGVDALIWIYPSTVRRRLLQLLVALGQWLPLQQMENWLKAEIIR